MRFSLIPFRTTMVMPADTVWKKYQVFSPIAELLLDELKIQLAKYGNYNKNKHKISVGVMPD